MSTETKRRIPGWLWGAVIVALGGVVGLLVVSDRRAEPGDAYRFDIEKHREVDDAHIIFREVERLEPGLVRLTALAVGPEGRIYVAGESALLVYGADGAEVAHRELPAAPDCMAVAPDGDVLLGMRDHVAVRDAGLASGQTWETLGENAYITSIAAGEKDVYVADAGNRVVLRFDRGGELLGRIGEADTARDIPGFIVPSPCLDLALDSHGTLWVVNPGRHGLENYRPNGELLSSWYRPSMTLDGFCGCCNPTHIAFLGDNSLVTAEKGISRVKLYAPDRTLLGLVAGPDAFEESAATAMSADLESPLRDIAVDGRGRVLVLDRRAGAVRIFARRTEP